MFGADRILRPVAEKTPLLNQPIAATFTFLYVTRVSSKVVVRMVLVEASATAAMATRRRTPAAANTSGDVVIV
ncbi:hypothetical protein L1987_19633 [Smallanthus sonchifolius]|uniref:Uncharacterized protein n=1 Tax=Smallanthus sonchifolius TaxID=185202 RepID=A0ACB9ISK2_9ASTR|nr:hypothetical protein L1987_19633 [Smallanthus sonchifolius]